MGHFEMDRYVNALNNYLSIHKFKNDNIARNYFPMVYELNGKRFRRVVENLFETDSSFNINRSEYVYNLVHENVKMKMLNGIGLINRNGIDELAIPYNNVEHISYTKIDSKHYHVSINATMNDEDNSKMHMIYNLEIEVS